MLCQFCDENCVCFEKPFKTSSLVLVDVYPPTVMKPVSHELIEFAFSDKNDFYVFAGLQFTPASVFRSQRAALPMIWVGVNCDNYQGRNQKSKDYFDESFLWFHNYENVENAF